MRIVELYKSIQGEGALTGVESVFVRASGCNLRCWFCDTPYSSWTPEGEDISVDDILEQVRSLGSSHVVVTGGEPMLFAELVPLTAGLRRLGRHITIETSGTLYLPVDCDLMSISPKLSSSTPSAELDAHWHDRHARNRHVPAVVLRLTSEHPYQLKFVIDTPDDCREVERYLADMPQLERGCVLLMPQGIDAPALAQQAAWLEPYCRQAGFQYCPRKQIEWFGLTRGT